MSATNDALPIPEPALEDSDAWEVVRAWIANDGMHCTMCVGQWTPHTWGILFSDIVRHVVDADVEATGRYNRELIRVITDKYMDEVTDLVQELDAYYARRN